MKKMERLLLAALLSGICLLFASCRGSVSAATMHLRKAEGTVGVQDGKGKEIEPMENLGLYSGYGVDTEAKSYAWIDLDAVKLTKLDQNSEVEIQEKDKHLTVEVKSGSLFFHVAEPLGEDETMEIHTSSMIAGIRGTCGWVEVPYETRMNIYLLEGTVECSNGAQTVTVSAGQRASIPAEGEITVEEFNSYAVPSFVRAELNEDSNLAAEVLTASGIDAAESSLGAYQKVLDHINREHVDGKVLYAEVVDFEADGNPELLALVQEQKTRNEVDIHIYTDPENPLAKKRHLAQFASSSYQSKISLVKSGGCLFTRECIGWISQDDSTLASNGRDYYYGFLALADGSPEGYRAVEYLQWGQLKDGETQYFRSPHDERGIITRAPEGVSTEISAGEYAAVQAQYTEERILLYSPDGETILVTPDPAEAQVLEP